MTVTGLPAAADNALSTLLATENLSSWKVDGTEYQTVVVLRFTKSKCQPFEIDNAKSSFRRKPPSQVTRDRERAQRHREYMNTHSTYHSSGSLELHCENNPRVSADMTVKSHPTVALSRPSPVTSDPLQADQCVVIECSELADKVSCVTVDQPQLGNAKDSAYEELPATKQLRMAMDQLNQGMQQISENLKSCVGKNAEGGAAGDTGIRVGSDGEGCQVDRYKDRNPSGDSLATARVTRQDHAPHQTQDSNLHRDGSHDDLPTSTRSRRKRTRAARRT